MYHSNNSLAGSPSFTIRTRRSEAHEGHYIAEAPHVEGMQAVEAPSEQEAVREMQVKLQQWLLTGAPQLKR